MRGNRPAAGPGGADGVGRGRTVPRPTILQPGPPPVPRFPLSLPALLCAAACAPAADPPDLGPAVDTRNPGEIRPTGPAPAWAPSLDPQMHAVLQQFAAFGAPDPTTLTAFQARNAPLPGDAVTALLKKTGAPPEPPKVEISHRVFPVGPEGGVLCRLYRPLAADGAAAAGPRPGIVYYHGGGWVLADLDDYEPSALALAEKTGATVVSVAYRLAPEHPHPAAHDDAFAAYRYVAENAAALGADPAKIAVAGESAGGNLAVAVALMAKDRGAAPPVHVLSVYPVVDLDVTGESYRTYADAKPLNKAFMEWFFDRYAPDWRTDRGAYPLLTLKNRDLSGLPPTTILNAEIDPLATDGEELAAALKKAGVPVERRTYPGVTHEFFGMAAILEQAEAAQRFAAARLTAAFRTP